MTTIKIERTRIVQHCEVLGKHGCGHVAVAWVEITSEGYNHVPMARTRAACREHMRIGRLIGSISGGDSATRGIVPVPEEVR